MHVYLPNIFKGQKVFLHSALILELRNSRSVDTTAALAVEGTHSYVDVNDVQGFNLVGVTAVQDDKLFADKEVTRHAGYLSAAIFD